MSQVTVCPVVGVTVGVQAARTGSTDEQSAAVASAKIDAVEHKLARTCSGALLTCRGTKRFDEDADCIIDRSRPGIREAEGSRFETTHRSAAQLTIAIAMQMRWRGRAVRFIFDRCRKGTTVLGHLKSSSQTPRLAGPMWLVQRPLWRRALMRVHQSIETPRSNYAEQRG